ETSTASTDAFTTIVAAAICLGLASKPIERSATRPRRRGSTIRLAAPLNFRKSRVPITPSPLRSAALHQKSCVVAFSVRSLGPTPAPSAVILSDGQCRQQGEVEAGRGTARKLWLRA